MDKSNFPKVDYNAPLVLTFTLVCLLIQVLDSILQFPLTDYFFSARGSFSFSDPVDYFRIFSHSMGHSGFQHLLSNSFILLLLGPILEEKYGWKNLLMVMFLSTLATSIINIILFDTGVRGASGIVFTFIVLASMVNFKKGTIPLTFLLVFLIHVGGEITAIFQDDNISQSGHIIGGIVGAICGFILENSKDY